MYKLLEITIQQDEMKRFSFNETMALKKDDWYRFYYFLPYDTYITGFIYQGLMVTPIVDVPKDTNDWQPANNLQPKTLNNDLLEKMYKLERHNLQKMRVNIDYIYTPMLTELLKYGVNSRADVAYLVRELYINGLDMVGAIHIFSTLDERGDLAPYFLQVANEFFEEVTV
ncbi:TPA: hypothetical protein U1C81_000637 [Streptococcus suis]|uniref:hypothetical protein n=1 Tax=Streptococcus suis TaxID=1307 RepID=UPI0003FDF2B6|nr:hypothetical protein [Streptococcus suis]NQL79138.1 hypothetical protein [Streptococcus suis]HEM3634292.1 hypothetical protein [Streptococcus suis]HEM3666905.1 hypothetical protein [Streptococcus suis]HEM3720881.1 hypothetical protein [Streptococcus suis]HEM4281500.1 hypothetical protein [Streptococcus suis]